jgi:hypothetical protein
MAIANNQSTTNAIHLNLSFGKMNLIPSLKRHFNFPPAFVFVSEPANYRT